MHVCVCVCPATVCNITACSAARLSIFGKKRQLGKENETLTCPAHNVTHLCLTEKQGKWKCPQGK